MNFEVRLSLLRYDGIQETELGPMATVTDLDTGSTFHIAPGQTLGQALAEFALRWQMALDRK